MYPIIFKFGPVTIYSYGLMLAIGFIAAVSLLRREAVRRGFNKDLVVDIAFLLIVSGLIGARILFVLLNLGFFLQNPIEIILINQGGLVWYGGLIASIIILAVFLKIKKQNFFAIADLFAPYAALAHAFGRIGCFLRGCCYGKPTDSIFGVYFEVHQAKLLPTQLFESFALAVIFFTLKFLSGKIKFTGGVFLFYLMLYSIFRFLIEFLRGDSPAIILGLTAFQLISIPILIISLALFFYARERQ